MLQPFTESIHIEGSPEYLRIKLSIVDQGMKNNNPVVLEEYLDLAQYQAVGGIPPSLKKIFSLSKLYTSTSFEPKLTATMATAFHLFSDLPAELRVRIWHIALEDDYDDLNGRNRIIELHSYSPKLKAIAVTVSRRYPTLFEVNREARCEAAKAGGGEWVTVKAHCQSRYESKHETSFSMYMNLSQDVLFLSSRFLVDDNDRRRLGTSIPACLEEKKLYSLINLLPSGVIKKIAYLMLTTDPIHGLPSVHYKGKLLELFTALKRIHFQAHPRSRDLPRISESVLQHVLKVFDAEPPQVSYHDMYEVPERSTLIWLSVSGMLDVEYDGIRKVEWGFRKDLWVPRAKNGSGTLQKIV
ncbi:hypothetical protein J4E93_003782 [Alternaria ventricosa]|uniref:uncharacterized protein n=1 Tax=Alternaria ventricosa TaxID=1187951 RepID=UPI0020C3F52E|nr:uncharacterized protein J4E93_003782 [Alternaria ventricosa]KAI4649462.1 hypothetical protein J4E93_003782 [Alternaria ventricosa]